MCSQSVWRPVKQRGRWHSGVTPRLWINQFWSPATSSFPTKDIPPPASCNPVTTPPPHRPSITQRGVYYPTCRMEGHRDRFVLSDRGSSEASMSCCLTNVDMMKEEILIAALSHINNKQNYLMDVHLCTCGSLSICKYADLDYSSQT